MAKAINLDFSGVKDRGNFNPKQVPDGDYAATIVKVEDAQSKDETAMYLFTIKLEKYSQHSYPYYCKIQENQLWKLRNLAVAAGLNVPKKKLKFDPNKVVGKKVGVTMQDEEYEGKWKSVIDAIFPLAELATGADMPDDDDDQGDFDADSETPVAVTTVDDDADDAPIEKPKKKKKAAEEPAAEDKPKKKKDKGGKKKKSSEENLEELDISDIG